MHGTADMLVDMRRSKLYVQQLKATMGAGTVDSFLRFYELPGFGHSVSAQFNAAWDQLTALEKCGRRSPHGCHSEAPGQSRRIRDAG